MDDWKKDLDAYFSDQKVTKKEIKKTKDEMKKRVKLFMQGKVLPAFVDLKKEFKKHKREIEVDSKKDWAAILVKKNKHKEFVYEVNISTDAGKLMVSTRIYKTNKKGKLKLGVEGKVRNKKNSFLLDEVKKEDIINDFLKYYKDSTRGK